MNQTSPFSADASLEAKFKQMSEQVNTLSKDPGNEVKLKMYALFKQATIGVNNTPKPGAFNFVAKAKWDAWSGLKDVSSSDAMKQYIDIVEKLLAADQGGSKAEAAPQKAVEGKYQTIKVDISNGVFTVTLNNPAKYNAVSIECYQEIGEALAEADANDEVTVAAMTGAGQYYCAGNDLSGFQKLAAEFNGDLQKGAQQGGIILEKYVSSYIDFSKPLVGLINGPAVGISVTVLGMFDLVLASSNATFHTPFPSLGQSPEGCSSYTFPLLMGHQRAVEMLVCEKKISAEEALERNLVTEVIPHENFHKVCQERLALLASLPPKSVMYGKALMRQQHKEKLHEVNKAECDRLVERWTSEECISAVMKFLSRKQSKM